MPFNLLPRGGVMRAAAFFLIMTLASVTHAADWPTYMHDNTRLGASAESPAGEMSQQWVIRSAVPPKPVWPVPQPGWTEHPKLKFDDALYAVVDSDTVYFGSSVDNSVRAIDAKSGVERWKFVTGGPVRLAPTLAFDHVYFGSDDGRVYCLKRSDGTLAWTFNATLDASRVLAGGRVSSPWAIRTNVLIDGDTAYFGAGVFPYHQTSAIAVDAHGGTQLWRNRNVEVFGGFSPQGYLLASKAGIIFPAGRSAPVCLDRKSGSVVFNAQGPKAEKGSPTGVYGLIFNQQLVTGTQNTLYQFNSKGEFAGRIEKALRLVAGEQMMYVLTGPPAPQYGRRSISTDDNYVTGVPRATSRPATEGDKGKASKGGRWTYKHPGLASMILAGDGLFAGHDNGVVLLDATTGAEKWSGKTDGPAVGLAFGNGRLIVSTTTGSVYCFASGTAAAPPPAVNPAPPSSESVALAQAMLRQAGVTRGFAVVTGANGEGVAFELARQSQMLVTLIESDPAQLPAVRRRVDAAGCAGRVLVESPDALGLPFPDMAANLVVQMPDPTPATSAALLRILKPCGGVLFSGAGAHRQNAEWAGAGRVTEDVAFTTTPGVAWTRLVRGELPGSGWWTHQYADAGGTGSSADKAVKGRLGVLWYGEPGGDEAPDRHQRGSSPLVMGGRVFMQGWQFLGKKTTVICFDAYNGVRYWETPVSNSIRLGLPGVSGNLACDASNVFVAAGPLCYRLDAATGQVKAKYEVPPRDTTQAATAPAQGATERNWGAVAIVDGVLVGSSAWGQTPFGDCVFAIDIETGKTLWSMPVREVRSTTVVVGAGRVFFAQNRNDPLAGQSKPKPKPKPATVPAATTTAKKTSQKQVDPAAGDAEDHDDPDDDDDVDRLGNAAPKETKVFRTVSAVELRTGRLVWERETDVTNCGRWNAMAFNSIQALCDGQVLVFAGANTPYGRPKPDAPPAVATALSVLDGYPLWDTVVGNRSRPLFMQGTLLAEPNFVGLKDGLPILRPPAPNGKQVAWKTGSRAGCGSLSASDSMIFGRSGITLWQNVVGPGGTGAFVGTRPGCLINIIPAGGVVVQVEASSGCTCFQAVQCTVVFKPVPIPPSTQPAKKK